MGSVCRLSVPAFVGTKTPSEWRPRSVRSRKSLMLSLGPVCMTNQTRRIAFCHLVLRGSRWMPVGVNRELGPNDRCSPSGAVISALLCAVVEGDAIVGWTENSGFMVREVGEDGALAPLDFRPTALAFHAREHDSMATAAGVVGISSLIANRRVREHNTGNLPG